MSKSEDAFYDDAFGWWVVTGAGLLDMLKDVADGADPDIVFLEAYANMDSIDI